MLGGEGPDMMRVKSLVILSNGAQGQRNGCSIKKNLFFCPAHQLEEQFVETMAQSMPRVEHVTFYSKDKYQAVHP